MVPTNTMSPVHATSIPTHLESSKPALYSNSTSPQMLSSTVESTSLVSNTFDNVMSTPYPTPTVDTTSSNDIMTFEIIAIENGISAEVI